jgi:hypothetical protein
LHVDRTKIVDYLLNPSHPEAADKARFFLALGFRPTEWHGLADALTQLASASNAAKQVKSPYGVKYIVDGRIVTPSGARPLIRSVWIVEHERETPRIVTAYPIGAST